MRFRKTLVHVTIKMQKLAFLKQKYELFIREMYLGVEITNFSKNKFEIHTRKP